MKPNYRKVLRILNLSTKAWYLFVNEIDNILLSRSFLPDSILIEILKKENREVVRDAIMLVFLWREPCKFIPEYLLAEFLRSDKYQINFKAKLLCNSPDCKDIVLPAVQAIDRIELKYRRMTIDLYEPDSYQEIVKKYDEEMRSLIDSHCDHPNELVQVGIDFQLIVRGFKL